MKIIAIVNQKGGVGKTNIAFNTAGVFSELGQKVLIVDMDAQGTMTNIIFGKKSFKPSVSHLLEDDPLVSISDVIQATHLENIHLLPSSSHLENLDARLALIDGSRQFLREALEEVRDDYDKILIDCPPSTSIATSMALIAAEGVIAPIQCTSEAVMASGELLQQIEAAKRHNPEVNFLGFVVNLFDARRALEKEFYQEIQQTQEGNVFEATFHDNVVFQETTALSTPITMLKPKSEQADSYRQFVNEL